MSNFADLQLETLLVGKNVAVRNLEGNLMLRLKVVEFEFWLMKFKKYHKRCSPVLFSFKIIVNFKKIQKIDLEYQKL